jgi:hypothetical protein
VRVYIAEVTYIDMENKENNPTVTVDSDNKKEEPKKEESTKKEK